MAGGLAVGVRITYNRVPTLGPRVAATLERGTQESGQRIADRARDYTPPRVATGAMMEGYRVAPAGRLRWRVFNTQDYHVFQELGTATISPHPMLIPAAAEEEHAYADRWARDLRATLG